MSELRIRNDVVLDLIPSDWKVEVRERAGGVQMIIDFPNNRGASVINNRYSYGTELAVLDDDGYLDYSTPITDDVIGHLTPQRLRATLLAIAALPAIQKAVTR